MRRQSAVSVLFQPDNGSIVCYINKQNGRKPSNMSDEEKFLSQFGDELYSPADKATVKTADVLSGKKVLLYFSGMCPPVIRDEFYCNRALNSTPHLACTSLLVVVVVSALVSTMSVSWNCEALIHVPPMRMYPVIFD